jgi:hypothetical protein
VNDRFDDERPAEVFDLYPAAPPGADVSWRVRRAQVVHTQTLTEASDSPYRSAYPHRCQVDHASPQLRMLAANTVAVSRALLLMVLSLAGAAVTVTLLVRVLEWLT